VVLLYFLYREEIMRDESEDLRRVGRDEMNLCEFPIALLTVSSPAATYFESRRYVL